MEDYFFMLLNVSNLFSYGFFFPFIFRKVFPTLGANKY